MTTIDTYHVPVLLDESINGLNLHPDGVYIDVTFGGGGHSREILRRLPQGSRLFSFDQDADAERDVVDDDRFTFVRSNFRYLKNWMRYYEIDHIDGLLADLGVSSHHFDDESRGFSFRFDAPLDMRMNKRADKTAADIVAEYDEEAPADIFYLYGELKNSRRIASALVKARQQHAIATTQDFLHVVEPFFKREREKKDMARLFQALRIEVNHEMEALKEMLACRHPTAGPRRQTLGHHLPLAGRPHRKERDEDGQCRGQDDTGLLRTHRDTLQTGKQQGRRAHRRRTATQPTQPKRQTKK